MHIIFADPEAELPPVTTHSRILPQNSLVVDGAARDAFGSDRKLGHAGEKRIRKLLDQHTQGTTLMASLVSYCIADDVGPAVLGSVRPELGVGAGAIA